tara:strand:+ start:10 stop:396 length:387 start_codon:yes stop_codon:yes gene_type:complete
MASGISPKLPLKHSKEDGFYEMHKETREAIKQDFKMLVLTSPGERVMDPQFGVGIRRYLFEPLTANTYESIRRRIISQASTYMSYIVINGMDFDDKGRQNSTQNTLYMKIFYEIPSLSDADFLELTIS